MEARLKLPASLPEPTGYHLLVVIPPAVEKTSGGILLPEQAKDKEQHASVVAYVAKVGKDAYSDSGRFPNGPWCKAGDYVLIKKYDGNRLMVDGAEVRVLNDDTVLAVVADPASIVRIF